MLVVKGNRSF